MERTTFVTRRWQYLGNVKDPRGSGDKYSRVIGESLLLQSQRIFDLLVLVQRFTEQVSVTGVL